MKLFGRKIVFPENGGDIAGGEFSDESNGGGVVDDERKLESEEDQEETQLSEINPQDKDQNPDESNSDENPKTPSIDEDNTSENDPKPENEQTGPNKTLKKPDKILPCPRCNSMDTKFCYYNNYNVNQPRHFCKSCQRYWTAGGTMRNVPVGAGRRKNKNATSHCHHITISQALDAARLDSHDPSFKPNATFLSFGPGPPVSSGLDHTDKRVLGNGCHKIDRPGPFFQKDGENVDDSSNGSTVTTSDGGKNGPQKPVIQNLTGFPYPVPCVPTVPWTYPVYHPGYPIPFYPGPYWNVPWVSIQPPTPNNQKATNSNHNSPLGKHSRDGELINRNNSESSIVVPKTLRIDDPEDAAKSSIWETLGIKYDSVSREGLFKALQPKVNEKKSKVSASLALHANPAALSRSINFQEGA